MKVVLITGASTGIGLAAAERLLEDGHFVILTARKDSLVRFAGCDFLRRFPNHWIRPLDVRSANERSSLINMIERDLGRLDGLINNAAVIYRAPIEYTYDFEAKEQMLVNFHAPLELIRCALPLLRKNGGGHIINVSSAAGFVSMPSMGLYAASKHALEAASEALHHELKPWNIAVSLIEPGFILSDAYQRTRASLAMDRAQGQWAKTYMEQTNLITELIDRASTLSQSSPEDMAEAISKALVDPHPPLRILATLDAKVLSFLRRFMPTRLFERLLTVCLGLLKVRPVGGAPALTPAPPG